MKNFITHKVIPINKNTLVNEFIYQDYLDKFKYFGRYGNDGNEMVIKGILLKINLK